MATKKTKAVAKKGKTVSKKTAKGTNTGRGKLAKVKLTTVQGFLKRGFTVGQVAKKLGCARFSLYQKFGKGMKGISTRGNRVTKAI